MVVKWSNSRIVNEVRKIADEIGYPVPKVQISDKMSKRFGKTDTVDKIVRLNKRFVELNSSNVIRSLIVHELVHLKFPDHGSGFKKEIVKLGYGAHIFKVVDVKMEKYRYECENCGIIYDNRKLRGCICKKCGLVVKERGKEIVKL